MSSSDCMEDSSEGSAPSPSSGVAASQALLFSSRYAEAPLGPSDTKPGVVFTAPCPVDPCTGLPERRLLLCGDMLVAQLSCLSQVPIFTLELLADQLMVSYHLTGEDVDSSFGIFNVRDGRRMLAFCQHCGIRLDELHNKLGRLSAIQGHITQYI